MTTPPNVSLSTQHSALSTDHYAELAELAGGFIHEIKNHLSTLGLNLQLLAEDFQDPQTQRERRATDRVQRLQNECQRLVDISNDFLRFARVKDLDLAPTNLTEVIEELIDFFGPTASQANIDIRTYLPADLPAVRLDRELFKQALLNLMLNAQQAMPGGGELTIQAVVVNGDRNRQGDRETGRQGDKEAGVSPCLPVSLSPCLLLSLIDTGKGMTPEIAARVFQPFYSTRPGGTGLGLPTAQDH